MLHVHRSNRVERLVDILGDVLAESPADPFEPETIIVQGRGMERWLSMELSRRFGVWANPSFPFPRGYLLDLFDRLLEVDKAKLECFEPAALAWAIAAHLPKLLSTPAFAPLATYLDHQDREGGLFDLSDRIAGTFDDYVVFRPKMIKAWEEGQDQSWQGVLWRQLVAELGDNHVANLAVRLRAGLSTERAGELPARISIFGVSTLAPLYLGLFAHLGETTDVHMYVVSPSHEYWADLRTRRDLVREWIQRGEYDSADEDEFEALLEREEGNRLLSSLGRIGREFQAVLEGTVDAYDDHEAYVDPAEPHEVPSALELLQSDMLNVIRRAPRAEHLPRELAADDDSIAVHSCHGPMREVQVLYDQLRGMFDRDPTLRPRDIIVMTPDVDLYAPFVEAVFAGDEPGAGIPHRIADRKPAATSDVYDAFREVLAVLRGRMTAADVVDLLRLPAVRGRFGVGDEDVEIIREWVDRVAVRWGMDAAHRQEKGHPPINQNTWEFGFRRLFLGFAMGGGEEIEFAGVSGYPDVEGGDSEVLGKLADLCEKLFSFARDLREPVKIDKWPGQIRDVLDGFFVRDGALAYQVQSICTAVDAIAERARAAGFEDEVGLVTIADLLDGELKQSSLARGFLSGAVTFCELVPMRTIPFEVVCLIGMRDDAFPRVERRPDFDLIAARRYPGDRLLRDDDRYMFLEALLSARRRLYVSYAGQSAHSPMEIPPSVVVQEMLDAVRDSFVDDGPEGRATIHTVRKHPLQAFSPSYFGGDGALRSSSRSAFRGARALLREPGSPEAFFTGSIPGDEDRIIDLDELVRFFENPSKAFLQRRLRLYLGDSVSALDVREPVDLDTLTEWQVADQMLRRLLDGQPCDFDSVSLQGVLPAGALGRRAYDRLFAMARTIAGGAPQLDRGDPLEIDLECDGERLVGVLPERGSEGQRYFQYSKLGKRQELALWVRHLAYCSANLEAAGRSRLVGRKGAKDAAVMTLEPIADAVPLLAQLMTLYRRGMEQPLPLFEHSSRRYALSIADGASPAAARNTAEGIFIAADGDRRDAYVRQLYGESSPFATGGRSEALAADVAVTVYAPFLAARGESSL